MQELGHIDDAAEMGKLLEKEKSVLLVLKLLARPWVWLVWVLLDRLSPTSR